MKHFKIILVFQLAILFILTAGAQQPTTNLVSIANLKPLKTTIHPVALKAIKNGENPASFKNVKVAFKPNVVILKKYEVQELKAHLKKGILPLKQVRKLKLEENNIYIDPASEAVLKPLKISDDTLLIKQPPLHAVIKDFKIPNQRVKFNLANTSYTLEGTRVSDEQKPSGDYLLKMMFNDTLYHIKKEIKTQNSKTTITVDLNLDGHLYITNPIIEAKYTGKNGYSFTVMMDEEAQIKASLKTKINAEVSVPLWAFDVPAGEYGSCKIGIFAFIDMNGKVELTYSINQNVSVKAGLKGKTLAYYPRTYHPIIDIKKKFESDYTIDATLKAFGGVEVTADIKVLKYDLAKVTSKAGPELEVTLTNQGKNFSAKAGARFKIEAKLIKIDKTFTLLDKYYLLWEYKQKNYGGYILEVKSVDAYNNRVWGKIISKKDSLPYKGQLVLRVKHRKGTHTDYNNISTNDKGIFVLTNIPLVKGDSVMIKIDQSPNWSSTVAANIPFKNIKLHYADYYNNEVQGAIASKIDLFPKQTTSISSQNAGLIPTGVKDVLSNPNHIKIFKPHISIPNNLFKNAITYKGDVQVIVESSVHKASLNLPPVKLGKNKHRYKRTKRTDIKLINPPVSIKKQVINLPFGAFVVKNVDIKPYDWVKVRINIDGFILESNKIKADGLVFSPAIDVNKQGGIYTATIKADDSYTVVNPLRGDKTPTGKLRLVKGIDMKHTSPKKWPGQSVEIPKSDVFKNAVHPLVYYDKTVQLKASDIPGFAEAHTGPWQVKNIYYDQSNRFKIQKFDGHRFEYLGYYFDYFWLAGYKHYQKTCLMDRDLLNKINQPSRINKIDKHKYLGY